jgi:hypothetical protein
LRPSKTLVEGVRKLLVEGAEPPGPIHTPRSILQQTMPLQFTTSEWELAHIQCLCPPALVIIRRVNDLYAVADWSAGTCNIRLAAEYRRRR